MSAGSTHGFILRAFTVDTTCLICLPIPAAFSLHRPSIVLFEEIDTAFGPLKDTEKRSRKNDDQRGRKDEDEDEEEEEEEENEQQDQDQQAAADAGSAGGCEPPLHLFFQST